MIDYIFSFTTQAAAQADATVGANWNGTTWAGNVNPGIQSWNPANDIVVSNTVTHTLTTGWWCMISVPAQIAALDNHANLVVCLDRDAAAGGALPATYIKKFSSTLFPNILSLLNVLRFQPVFAGSHYASLGVT